jgi:hypothetical protein
MLRPGNDLRAVEQHEWPPIWIIRLHKRPRPGLGAAEGCVKGLLESTPRFGDCKPERCGTWWPEDDPKPDCRNHDCQAAWAEFGKQGEEARVASFPLNSSVITSKPTNGSCLLGRHGAGPLVASHDDLQHFFGGGERQFAHSQQIDVINLSDCCAVHLPICSHALFASNSTIPQPGTPPSQ